jgi:hypothetical protein
MVNSKEEGMPVWRDCQAFTVLVIFSLVLIVSLGKDAGWDDR